jgi:protein-tyrosine-phosphatase
MKVLFVCTLNKARSVVAERLYRGMPGMQVRSAGTSNRAAQQTCGLWWNA